MHRAYRKTLVLVLVLLGLSACDDRQTTTTAKDQNAQRLSQFHTASAIEELQRQLRDKPNDFASLSRLGDLYFESGQYLSAIQTYDRALAVNPACADCLNDKGLALFFTGDLEGALRALNSANEVDPGYPNAWLSKGYVLMSSGRYEEAVAPLQQVEALDPSGVLAAEARRFLAMIAEQRGQTR